MSPRAVYRYVPHIIRHDTEGGMVYEVYCTALHCGAYSKPREVQEAAQDWALRHTGRTGHALFRRVVTDHARVTRDE